MIIGIFGQMGNGKSTFARQLIGYLNEAIRMNMGDIGITNVFHLSAFARAVKESVATKYKISLADIEKWKNNPEKFPNNNLEGAKAFADFITSPEGQTIIAEFGVEQYGEPLFFADAHKTDAELGLP